jgi:multiple sugar transport system permease protein
MARSIQARRAGNYTFLYAAATFFFVLLVFPYIYMVLQSLAPWDEVNRQVFPSRLTFRSFEWIFTGGAAGLQKPWMRALLNSTIVTVSDTVTRLLAAMLAGYALSRLKFFGRKRINDVILFHMFYPGIILLVPTFLIVRNLGIYNTYWAMIIPRMVDVWAIFMYKNFFGGIDRALTDSARVYGASHMRIIFSIMVPMSKPITTVIFLFLFMQRWVQLLWDLLVVKEPMRQTLNVLLATMFGPYGNYPGPLYAASVILTFPILILFAIFRKQFVQGVEFVVK